MRLARTIRSGKGPGPGFQGGALPAHMHCVQHFTRSMLLAATHATPGLLDGLTMGDLRGWLPDERDLLRPLDTWSCRDVSEAFATLPLFLAAWACLIHQAGDERMRAVLAAQDAQILEPFVKYERDRVQYAQLHGKGSPLTPHATRATLHCCRT